MFDKSIQLEASAARIQKLTEEITRLKAQLKHTTEDRDKFRRLCMIDGPTGLLNQRGLAWEFPRLLAQVRRKYQNQEVEIHFMVIDVNNLKPLNDRYGHLVGDEAIEVVAKALQESIRKDEIAARTGGDEFLLVILAGNEGNIPENQNLEDAILKRVLEIIWADEKKCALPPISLSIGVSRFPISSDRINIKESEAILERQRGIADENMYRAKKHYKESDFILTQSILFGEQELRIFCRNGVAITRSSDK